MRFMILVKASNDFEAGAMPDENMIAKMVTYHEELQEVGALVDASGLQPSSKGWRIKYSGGKRKLIDGPFTETKELIAGYTIIKAKSSQQAIEWTQRFPNPHNEDGETEVRPLFELEDFGPSEAIERFRELRVATEK